MKYLTYETEAEALERSRQAAEAVAVAEGRNVDEVMELAWPVEYVETGTYGNRSDRPWRVQVNQRSLLQEGEEPFDTDAQID